MSIIPPTRPTTNVPGLDIDLSTIVSVSQLLERAAKRYGQNEAVVSKWQQPWNPTQAGNVPQAEDCLRWSYHAMLQAAKGISTKLQEAGVQPGNVICIASTTCIEWCVAFWASILGSFIFMPIDPSAASSADDIRHVLEDIDPAVFVVSNELHAKKLDEVLQANQTMLLKITLDDKMCKVTAGEDDSWIPFSNLVVPRTDLELPKLSKGYKCYEDVTLISYTSGTTALPKACLISGSNIMSSILAMQEASPLDDTERLLHHLPGHVSMSMVLLFHIWAVGGATIFPARAFDPVSTLRGIDEERCTFICTVPAIVNFMCSAPVISQFDTSSLRTAVLSGAPATVQALRLCLSKLKADFVGFGWGMTECGAILFSDLISDATNFSPDDFVMKPPKAGVGIKICDPESNKLVRHGEVGELHVCAGSVIRGYLNSSVSPCYEDGGRTWLRTGDLATLDPSGGVRIAGRLKDMIIRGGLKIAPVKIESCLNYIEGVAVQIVGYPDEVAGEVPVAVVWDQRKPTSGDITSSNTVVTQLQQAALIRLDRGLVPVAWVDLRDLGVPGFPVTPAGKPKKAALAALVRQYIQAKGEPLKGVDLSLQIEDVLTSIWSHILGFPSGSVQRQDPITKHADSISIMKFSSTVRQSLHKYLTIGEILRYPSIAEQAKLLGDRSKIPRTDEISLCGLSRDDMIYHDVDDMTAEVMKQSSGRFLSRYDLSWDDVEAVFAIPDTSRFMLKPQRPRSWNQKIVLLSRQPSEKVQGVWKALSTHHQVVRMLSFRLPEKTKDSNEDHEQQYFAVVKDRDNWWHSSLRTDLKVDNTERLEELAALDICESGQGALVKVSFVEVQSTKHTAIILTAHHASIDYTYVSMLLQDLKSALELSLSTQDILMLPSHIPFQAYAALHSKYRNSTASLNQVQCHTSRFLGCHALRRSLWPVRRAAGLMTGDDTDWASVLDNAGDLSLRKPLDARGSRLGLNGITKTARATGHSLANMGVEIEPRTLVKAAIALFNMAQTKTQTALFGSIHANREWPFASSFIPEDSSVTASNPMDIAGPTVRFVPDRVDLQDDHEIVKDFLHRLQAEHQRVTQNAGAPLYLVLDQLEQADADVVMEILQLQIFNWTPFTLFQAHSNDSPDLQLHSHVEYDDLGISWSAGVLDKTSFYLNASYDDCQLSSAEVSVAVDEVLRAAVWLSDERNYVKTIQELLLSIKTCAEV